MSDLVRREDVIKQLKDELYYNDADKGIYVHGTNFWDSELVERIIKNDVPSAEPAKRIVGKSRDGMTLWYQCDMCNEPVDAQDDYCRGCGRRLIDG